MNNNIQKMLELIDALEGVFSKHMATITFSKHEEWLGQDGTCEEHYYHASLTHQDRLHGKSPVPFSRGVIDSLDVEMVTPLGSVLIEPPCALAACEELNAFNTNVARMKKAHHIDINDLNNGVTKFLNELSDVLLKYGAAIHESGSIRMGDLRVKLASTKLTANTFSDAWIELRKHKRKHE